MEATQGSRAVLGQELPATPSSVSSDHLEDLYQYFSDPNEQYAHTVCCQRLRCLESVRAIEVPRGEKPHFILQNVKVLPKRSSKSDNSPRRFSRKYYLPGKDGNPIVVCKEAFIKAVGVSSQFIDRTLKTLNATDDECSDGAAFQESDLSTNVETSSTVLSQGLSVDEIVQRALSDPVKLKQILQEKPELAECISIHFTECSENASPPNSPDTGLGTLKSQETSRQKRPLSSPESGTSLTKETIPKKSRDSVCPDSYVSDDNQITYPSFSSNSPLDPVFFTYYSKVNEQSAGEAAEVLLDENLHVSSDASIQEESMQKRRPYSRDRQASLTKDSSTQGHNSRKGDILAGKMKHLDLNTSNETNSKKTHSHHLNENYCVPGVRRKARLNTRKNRTSRHKHNLSAKKPRRRRYQEIPNIRNLFLQDEENSLNPRNKPNQDMEGETESTLSAFKRYRVPSNPSDNRNPNPPPERTEHKTKPTRTKSKFYDKSFHEGPVIGKDYKEFLRKGKEYSDHSSSDEGYGGNSDKVFVFGTGTRPSNLYPRYKSKKKSTHSQPANQCNTRHLYQEKTVNQRNHFHYYEIPDLSSLTLNQEAPARFKNAPSPPPYLPRPIPSKVLPVPNKEARVLPVPNKEVVPTNQVHTREIYTNITHSPKYPPSEGATIVGKKLTIAIFQPVTDFQRKISPASSIPHIPEQRATAIKGQILPSLQEPTSRREKQKLQSPEANNINGQILPSPQGSGSHWQKQKLEGPGFEEEKLNLNDACTVRYTVPFSNSMDNDMRGGTSLQQEVGTHSRQIYSSKQSINDSLTHEREVYQRPFEIRRAVRNYDNDTIHSLEDINLANTISLRPDGVADAEEGDIVRGLECRVTVSHRTRPRFSSDPKTKNSRKKGNGSCVIL